MILAVILFGAVNLSAATVIVRGREQALGAGVGERLRVDIPRILALALIVVVLGAAIALDALVVVRAWPEVGRALLYVLGAAVLEIVARLFAVIPNAPIWVPRALRWLEGAILILGLLGVLLAVLVAIAG